VDDEHPNTQDAVKRRQTRNATVAVSLSHRLGKMLVTVTDRRRLSQFHCSQRSE